MKIFRNQIFKVNNYFKRINLNNYFKYSKIAFSTSLPNPDEDINFLVNEFNKITSSKEINDSNNLQNKLIYQKENVVFINNSLLEELNIIPKFGQTISFNNGKYMGKIISLQSKITIVILTTTTKEEIMNPTFELKEFSKIKTTPELNKTYKVLNFNYKQLFTGNLLIDCLDSIYQGNFITIKSKNPVIYHNIIEDTINRFEGKVIILTQNLVLKSRLAKLSKENYDIDILSFDSNINSKHFIQEILLEKVKESKLIKNTLVIIDDYFNYYISSRILYTTANLYIPHKNYINELYSMAGTYNTISTSILVTTNEQILNHEFKKDFNIEFQNLVLLSDKVLDFTESNYKSLKNINFLVEFTGVGLNYITNNYIRNLEYLRFRSYIKSYLDSNYKYEEMSKLGVADDPSENFEYYDSKIIFEMLEITHKNQLFENLNFRENIKINDIIILKFIDFVIFNEYHSYFNGKGDKIAIEFFKFLNLLPKEEKNILLKYSEFYEVKFLDTNKKELNISSLCLYTLETENSNPSDKFLISLVTKKKLDEYEAIQESLFIIFEKYMKVLKRDGIIGEFKKDYLD